MRIERGDYCIVGIEKKKYLVEITDTGRQLVGIVSDRSRASRETLVQIPFALEDILVNLGDDPRPGRAFGVKTEPWKSSNTVKPWGDIHFFRTIEDDEHEILMDTLNRVGRTITKMGLADALPVIIEVRPKDGIRSGLFNFRGNKTDIVTYHPENFADADYVVWHEDAHRVWYRLLSNEVRAKWIKLYHESVLLAEYPAKEVLAMKKQFMKAKSSIAEFRGELGEEDAWVFDAVITWITGWHGLSKVNLDTLIHSYPQDFAELWPERELENFDQELVVSEYAGRSPEEFFAEAWSFHYSEFDEVPKRIVNAVERTYQSIGL